MLYASSDRQPARRSFRLCGRLINFIGPDRQEGTETAIPVSADWIASIFLMCALAILLIALGQGAARRGADSGSLLFWGGVVLLLLPTATRIAWPSVARAERLCLLLVLTESLLVYRLLYSPTSFVQFDEMLHWISAHDVLYRHKLFLDNSLLPISPHYPAIEIAVTALANLAKIDVFPAAMLVIAVLRGLFIAALFVFFETLSGSPRLAAVGCLAYMGCDNYVGFDSIFAYETLGIVLCIVAIMVEARAAHRSGEGDARSLALLIAVLASLAVTHHVSAFVCAFYFATLLTVEALRRHKPRAPRRLRFLAIVTLAAILLPLAWMAMSGDQLWGYLGPRIDSAANSVARMLAGTNDTRISLLNSHESEPRRLFVSESGQQQQIGYRILGLAWTVLIALALASGFFRSLAMAAYAPARLGWQSLRQVLGRQWRDSRIVLLTLAAFGFPLSVVLRLTPAGWEIGNRAGPFIFVGVGFVVAVSIVHFWQSRNGPWRLAGTSVAIATIVLGGLTIGSGNQALQGPYAPGADAASIEPMGIAAARWAKDWLGEGNRFAADRVNRLLLATYGQQDLASTLRDRIDESRIFVTPKVSPDVVYWIRKGSIDYLLADLRITTARSVLGQYYEADEINRGSPPPSSMLLKFDDAPQIGRVFDDGWIVIFDVRALHAAK
jgi:hypothetical protein